MEINKILVPVDFSDESNNAMNIAASLAKKLNAKITLFHAIDTPVVSEHKDSFDLTRISTMPYDDPGMYRAYMDKITSRVKDKITELKEKHSAIEIQEHIVFDDFQKQLYEIIEKENTDLIVLGSKGASGFEEVMIGSNAEKIIRHAKKPVITVKDPVHKFDLKNIVFASSFEKVNKKVIDFLFSFQKAFESKMHLLKIISPNSFSTTKESQNQLKKFAIENNLSNYSINIYNSYSEEEGIRDFAKENNADLIAMTTHGRTGLSHLFLGSIAEEVTNHSVLPVLTFNEKMFK